MLVVFLGIAAAFQLSVNVVTNNKARAGAIALANERMEYLRSLSYTQIGVIGGIPAGNVPQEDVVALNGVSYTRRTAVLYSDDPGDGVGVADANDIIADYKTIRVEVSWDSHGGERSVALVGRVSPNGVETNVPGGTLIISVVDAAAAPVSNTQVDIINNTVVPAIGIRTYTNTAGVVNYIGAPAASDYQITVSKSGYSTAQTYPVSGSNPNPDPRHVSVSNDQTTSSIFAIDRISSKTVETYNYATPGAWADTFEDTTKLSVTDGTEVSGGRLRVAGSAPFPPSVSAQSVTITPQNLTEWDELLWNDSEPSGTNVTYYIYQGDGGAPIPASALPGNDMGFTNSPVDISTVPVATYPSIRLHAVLTTSPPAGIPSADDWTISYFSSALRPNTTFSLRGIKTIGNNPAVYKYSQTHTSDGGGILTLASLEWDTYTLAVASTTGFSLARTCPPQSETLAPAGSPTTQLFVVPASTHSLLVDVRGTGSTLLTGASMRLTKSGYDRTQVTAACGQTYFGNLAQSSYTATVNYTGYAQYSTSIDVNDATRLSVILTSL